MGRLHRRWVLIGNSSAFHEAWKTFKRENIAYAEVVTVRRVMTNFPHLFKANALAIVEEMERDRPEPVHPPFQCRIDFELP